MVPPVPRPRPVAGSPWPGPRRRRWGRAILSAVPPVSEPSASSWRLSALLLPDAGPCTRSPGVTVTSLCRPQSSSSPRRAAYAARLPPGHPHDLRSPQLPQQDCGPPAVFRHVTLPERGPPRLRPLLPWGRPCWFLCPTRRSPRKALQSPRQPSPCWLCGTSSRQRPCLLSVLWAPRQNDRRLWLR